MAFFKVKPNMNLVPKQKWPAEDEEKDDEKDEIANDLLSAPSQKEFIERLNMLHSAIQPDLVGLVQRKGAERVSSAQYIRSHSHIRHLQYLSKDSQEVFDRLGCDFGKLYDIKLVFDQTRGTNNRVGYPEKEFVALAARAICPTFPNALTSWFNMIDVDGTGYVDWPKLSTYLLTVCANMNDQKGKMSANRYNELPKGRLASNPGYQLLKMIPNTLTKNSFYCVCNDGNIREYSTDTMKSMNIVHHADGTRVSDMKFLPERNQIYVAQESGLVLIYDGAGECTRTGTILKAMRVGRHPANEPLEHIKKSVKFDPLRMVDAGMHDFDPKVTVASVSIEVCPLKPRQSCHCLGTCKCNRHLSLAGNTLKCVEPVYDSESKNPAFFTGYENGYLAYHRPDLFTPEPCVPVAVWQPHKSWVTKMMLCTNHPEIQGLVSSSADSSIVFTDSERLEPYAKMTDHCHGDDGGGWINGVRPVTSFDISDEMPLIVSCGNMRSVSFWAGDSRKKVAVVHDHKANVIDVCFNRHTHQAISLGDDRTIRVWDTRMYRVMQTISHKDHLASVMVDPAQHSICAGTGIVLQHSLIDEDDIAAVAAASAEQSGTVTSTMVNTAANQLVTCDGVSLSGWDINDGGCYFTCKFPDQITAWTMDVAFTKFFVATADGNLSFVMYGSPKPARQYHLSVASPISSLLHLHVQDLPPMIVCGLKDGSVLFYGEKSATTHLTLLYSTHLSSVTGGASTLADAVAEASAKAANAFSPGGFSQSVRGRSGSNVLNTNSGFMSSGFAGSNGGLNSSNSGLDPLESSMAAAAPPTLDKNDAAILAQQQHDKQLKELQQLQQELGAVNLLALVKGNTITCCTSGGYVAVVALHPSGPVVFHLLAFDSKVLGQKNRAASAATAAMRTAAADQQQVQQARPRPKTGHLWQRVLQATKKERDLSSAGFTKFRHEAQMLMKRECESVVICSQTHALFTFGNGDALLLKIVGKTVTATGLFPLSCGSGCACVATFKFGKLYVADDTGALSIFDLDTDRFAPANMGNARYFVNTRIKLSKVLRLPSPVVDLAVAAENIVVLVVEAPRPLVINTDTESVIWGPRLSIGGVKTHRFAEMFPNLVIDGALMEPSAEEAELRKKKLDEVYNKRDRSSSLVEASVRSRSNSRVNSLNNTPQDTALEIPSLVSHGGASPAKMPLALTAVARMRSNSKSPHGRPLPSPGRRASSSTNASGATPRSEYLGASGANQPLVVGFTDHLQQQERRQSLSGDSSSGEAPLSALAARKKKKQQVRQRLRSAAVPEALRNVGDNDAMVPLQQIPSIGDATASTPLSNNVSLFGVPPPITLSPTALTHQMSESGPHMSLSPTLGEHSALAGTQAFGHNNSANQQHGRNDSIGSNHLTPSATPPPQVTATPTQLLLMGKGPRQSIQLDSKPLLDEHGDELHKKRATTPALLSNQTTDERMNLLFNKYVPERRAHTINFLRSHNTGGSQNKKAASEAPRALASVKAKKAAKESEADVDSRWYRRLQLEQLSSLENPLGAPVPQRLGFASGAGGGGGGRSQSAMAGLYGNSSGTTILGSRSTRAKDQQQAAGSPSRSQRRER